MIESLRTAARDLEIETEHAAAELVKRGVPLWTALEQAQDDVRRRRQGSGHISPRKQS